MQTHTTSIVSLASAHAPAALQVVEACAPVAPDDGFVIERVALKARVAYDAHCPALRCLTAPAMAQTYAAVDALNRGVVNGQESQSSEAASGQTWADLFSSRRLAAEYDELWLKRGPDHGLAGYAAVRCGVLGGAELGLITMGRAHRGRGRARELIGAILGAHPVLHLYVGERNVRAQALYQSFAHCGCQVRRTGTKYYDNGELALGMTIERGAAAVAETTTRFAA